MLNSHQTLFLMRGWGLGTRLGTHCTSSLGKITINFCLPAERPHCRVILPVRHGQFWCHQQYHFDSNGLLVQGDVNFKGKRLHQSRAAAFSWNGRRTDNFCNEGDFRIWTRFLRKYVYFRVTNIDFNPYYCKLAYCLIINPRRACAARVTVLGLYVCMSVTQHLTLYVIIRATNDTNLLSGG